MRKRLFSICWILVGLYPLVWQSVASASLFLEFTPASAPSGAQVQARTVGDGAASAAAGSSLSVFLADRDAGDPEDLRTSELVPLGSLDIDVRGNGTLAATIPAVRPGNYQVVVDCPPCAPTSGGRSMLPVGLFRVTPGVATESMPGPAGRVSGPLVTGLIAGSAVVFCVVLVAALSRRNARRQ